MEKQTITTTTTSPRIGEPKLKNYFVAIELSVKAESKKTVEQIFDSLLFGKTNIDCYRIAISKDE